MCGRTTTQEVIGLLKKKISYCFIFKLFFLLLLFSFFLHSFIWFFLQRWTWGLKTKDKWTTHVVSFKAPGLWCKNKKKKEKKKKLWPSERYICRIGKQPFFIKENHWHTFNLRNEWMIAFWTCAISFFFLLHPPEGVRIGTNFSLFFLSYCVTVWHNHKHENKFLSSCFLFFSFFTKLGCNQN